MKFLFFFQTFRNFERTFTVLGEKVFGRDIKIEKSTFHLLRSIKNQNFESSLFFQFLQNFERTFTVLGGKVLGRDNKIENCTLSLQRIMLRMKLIFESFVSFPFIRTWNKNFLDLWQQSFLPGCQNCTLRVYLNSLWDVGMRSETIKTETFSEIWRKNFDLFVKTAFYVSKGTLWVKKQRLNVLIFFQTLQNFERTFTVLGENFSGRDNKVENCTLCLQSIILRI